MSNQKMISFPSIEQFRNVVRTVTTKASYVGQTEEGTPIFDPTRPIPTLKFEGTIKLHGTNGGIVMQDGEMWVQSRSNIITPIKDNAGFAMHVEQYKQQYHNIFNTLNQAFLPSVGTAVCIFGEWCGGNIQAKVSITKLPKMFVVFGVALVDSSGTKHWIASTEVLKMFRATNNFGISNLYHINQFPTYDIDIDFANPHLVQNILTEMTTAVENNCPVGDQLGANSIEGGTTIGEGIVWKCVVPGYLDSGFWFKVKGEAHSNSKVKTLVPIDIERINSIVDLAAHVTPDWRLEQMYQHTFDIVNGGVPDIKLTGQFIKNVMADVLKECMDEIAASGFTSKDISGPISKRVKNYLNGKL